MVSQSDIIYGLKSLGLRVGQTIIMHSSLSSFGYVDGGANTLIDCLIQVIGPTGTLVVPTFTGKETLSPSNPPIFRLNKTKSWTGLIPETFRKRCDAIRSVHPTHSVAAIGHRSKDLTYGHVSSITPCDELSPFGKLSSINDSYVLLVGVDHEVNTMFHHVEEIAGVDYHIQPKLVKTQITAYGRKFEKHFFLHKYGSERNFNVMENVFIENKIQSEIRIGNALLKFIQIKMMVELIYRALRVNKKILLKT